nr:hypothetical protein [Tanacetum cinerariifolium]
MQHTPPPCPRPQPQAQPQPTDFPLSLLQTALDACAALTSRIEKLESDKVSQALEITKLKKRVKRLEKDDTIMEDVSNQGRMIDELDRDEGVALIGETEVEKKTKEAKDIEDELAEVDEVVEVVTTAKLITEVVTAASESVSAASTTVPAAEPQVPAATPTAVPIRVDADSTKRRKRVVIRDLEEASTTIKPTDTKSKDKGKGKMQKAKEDPAVQRYYVIKKRPQTEAQARKNMIMYLKNVVGFRLDYFKGMSYDDIPQKAAKRRKLNEEIAELNKHLEIVPDEDDDVYTKATPLARKVPVVDYAIILLNNKPHYKIIKADGTHQLKYPLSRYTLDQMLNAVKLRVEEHSEMSLELLSFGVDAAKELEEKHQVFNAAGEELSVAKQKLMLLD